MKTKTSLREQATINNRTRKRKRGHSTDSDQRPWQLGAEISNHSCKALIPLERLRVAEGMLVGKGDR